MKYSLHNEINSLAISKAVDNWFRERDFPVVVEIDCRPGYSTEIRIRPDMYWKMEISDDIIESTSGEAVESMCRATLDEMIEFMIKILDIRGGKLYLNRNIRDFILIANPDETDIHCIMKHLAVLKL